MRKYQPLRVLVVNPGSTSTKVAVYEGEEALFSDTIMHGVEELARCDSVPAQLPMRLALIEGILKRWDIAPGSLSAVVGRGGILDPVSSGTYLVGDRMLAHLGDEGRNQHAASLGGLIAYDIAQKAGVPAYVVDPIVVDEFDDIARISGLPDLPRTSMLHALNQKATARRACAALGKAYDDANLIVAHMGGGITVGAHRRGRVVDVNNGLGQEGPFSPERCGTLPAYDLVKLCYSGKYTQQELLNKLNGKGGLIAHLGTNDGREVAKRIEQGDQKAALVYQAMAYQVCKEIGAMASVLCGEVDCIVLTGGIAYDQELMEFVRRRVSYIAPIFVYPGQDEMLALAQGALRILYGQEQAKEYMGLDARA